MRFAPVVLFLSTLVAQAQPIAVLEGTTSDGSLRISIDIHAAEDIGVSKKFTYLAGVSSLAEVVGQEGTYVCKYQLLPHMNLGRAQFNAVETATGTPLRFLRSQILQRHLVWASEPFGSPTDRDCTRLAPIPEKLKKTQEPLFIDQPVWPLEQANGCESEVIIESARSKRPAQLKKHVDFSAGSLDRWYWSPAELKDLESVTLRLERKCPSGELTTLNAVLQRR